MSTENLTDAEKLSKAIGELTEIKSKLESKIMTKELFEDEKKKLNSDLESVKAQLKDLSEQLKLRSTAFSGFDEDVKKGKVKFHMGKLIAGALLGHWVSEKTGQSCKKEDCETYNHVKDYMGAIKRDAHSTTGGSGGYAIAPQMIMTYIEGLYNKLVLAKAGATVLTNLSGSPVYIPKLSASTNGYWVGEGSTITESKITDAQVSATPKKAAGLVTFNNELLRLAASNPSAEALVIGDMDKVLRLLIDLAGLRGSGSDYQPRGVANTSNINTLALGADGDIFNCDKVIDMEGKLDDSNALDGKLAFITHGKVKRMLRKTKIAQYSGDTGGQYVVTPLSDMALKDFIGYDMHTTGQIPTNLTKGNGTALSEVYFGNWADLVLCQWGGIDIAASDSAGNAFEQDQTKMRMIQLVDWVVRHPQSFCLCNDARTV